MTCSHGFNYPVFDWLAPKVLTILFRPFDWLAPKVLTILFRLTCSQGLLHYLTSNLLIMSVTWWKLLWASPDEGYYERHLMKVIMSVAWWRLLWASPDEGYYERHLVKVIMSVTWWRLFLKRVVVHKIRYPRFYLNNEGQQFPQHQQNKQQPITSTHWI